VTDRRRQGLAANPVLVGAVTLLVVLVAVFLSYNANSGLPFVPTYELQARMPNAANLVPGNEVRVGGVRVGLVDEVEAVRGPGGRSVAELRLKLEDDLDPLPIDSTFVVRPVSALGLKYVALTPGRSRAGFAEGATVPIDRARPTPVEIDEVFNMFDGRTRRGIQLSLQGFGSGFAGRGDDLNEAISSLRPLVTDLAPVMANLADPRTRLDRLFRALGATAAEVAPVAETQAALFANLDTTFAALAGVARPFIQETISEAPRTFAVGTAEFPRQRPFVRNSAALFRELRPGFRTLPASAPVLAEALTVGTRTLPRTPPLNRRLASVFDSLAEFADDPLVPLGVRRLGDTARVLRPTVAFLTPAQAVCNYPTLWFRNVSSLLSEGDSNGTWQRFIIVATPVGPNSEGFPSSAPANGPGVDNHLHSNPYPNTAAPGQPRECEAGNEDYAVGRTTIGNLPGNQGTETGGQDGPSLSAAGGGAP
jgi:virulence factor Mce-like protein